MNDRFRSWNRLQLARRATQIFAVFIMFLAPALARYQNYLAARELDSAIDDWTGTVPGTALAAIDFSLRSLPGGEEGRAGSMRRNRDRVLEYAQTIRGGPWSLEVGPISLTDPLAVVESWVARGHADRVLFVGALIPVMATLLLGRVFCGWICPMGFLLELTDRLRRVLRWLELQPRDVRPWRPTKHVLLAVGLIGSAAISLPLLGLIYPPAVLGRETHAWVFGLFDRAEQGRFGWWPGGIGWMGIVLMAIVLVEVTVSRRWWCRYVCPGGALYALLGRWRVVRVQLAGTACNHCGDCNRVCHLGLRPMAGKMGMDCDNCGQCISICRQGALGYGIGRKDVVRSRKARVGGRPGASVGALGALVLLVTASPTHGHHILGIPHYAYDERYPQVPTLTYRVDIGAYEVELTGYPGHPTPGQPCFINIYIRRLTDRAPFEGPVEFLVQEDRMFAEDRTVYGPVRADLEESVFKFYPRFPREANYLLHITFEGEGAPYSLQIPMVVGEPGSPWRVLAFAASGVVLFLLIIRAIRIKRDRAASAKK